MERELFLCSTCRGHLEGVKMDTWIFIFEKHNLAVKAENFSEACKEVEEAFYPGIFETARSFQVCKVTDFSRRISEEE